MAEKTKMILKTDEIISKDPFPINGKFQILCAMPENPFVKVIGETNATDFAAGSGLIGKFSDITRFYAGDAQSKFTALGSGDRIIATPLNGGSDVILSLTGKPIALEDTIVSVAANRYNAASVTFVDGVSYKVSAAPVSNEWGNRTVVLEAKSPHAGDTDKWFKVVDPKSEVPFIQWGTEGFIEVEGAQRLVYRLRTSAAGCQASLHAVRSWISSRPGR